eukprot:jgi/Mesen1/8718/ME000052S08148
MSSDEGGYKYLHPISMDSSIRQALLSLTVAVLLLDVAASGARLIQLPSDELAPFLMFNRNSAIVTTKPLIGILSQPGDGNGQEVWRRNHPGASSTPANVSFIAASYVKFVEAGGARAVPIIYNESPEKIAQMAMDANNAGDYFPVQATCLGMEMVTMTISKKGRKIFDRFSAKRPSTLHFAGPWAKNRNMFEWMSPALLDKLTRYDLTMENHVWGLSPEAFAASKELSDFFNVLTTSIDDNGKVYVSSMEAKQYPITSLQWHPEKNAFEWGLSVIPHTADAVAITQTAAGFFVNEARKSWHKPRSRQEENELLIYNFNPVFSGKAGMGKYEQAYVFGCEPGPDQDCGLNPGLEE